MLRIKFNNVTSGQMDKMHKSLMGWNAYINNDVTISKDNNVWEILIGPDNDEDTYITVDITDIER